MKYITKVDEQEFIIEITQDDHVLVNGELLNIDFRQVPGSDLTSLLLNNRSLEAVVAQDEAQWEVLIKGELYHVQVQDERAFRLAQARGGETAVTGDASVKSPMPGIVISIPVAAGDVVQKGDTVIILESMKMENELRAPRDGIVSRIHVEAGATVEKGEMLVMIGDEE